MRRRVRTLTHEGFEYREAVIGLASHAISQMAGVDFVVKLDATILFGDSLTDEIVRRVGRPVSITISHEPGITGGGVVIEDAEARQIWDNRLGKRWNDYRN
jgi:hypothetical protein